MTMNGKCNRTVCQNAHDNWFNHSTERLYCQPCKILIESVNPPGQPEWSKVGLSSDQVAELVAIEIRRKQAELRLREVEVEVFFPSGRQCVVGPYKHMQDYCMKRLSQSERQRAMCAYVTEPGFRLIYWQDTPEGILFDAMFEKGFKCQ